MFVIPDAKVVFLFNPRTGTHTHHHILWQHRDKILIPEAAKELRIDLSPGLNHLHLSYSWVQHYHPNMDLSKYRIFGFYRNPTDWFLSAISYLSHKDPQSFHMNMSPRAFWERKTTLKRQISIIGPPAPWRHVELFNFHDFTNETIRAFGEMGIDLKPEDIPVKNQSEPRTRQLTQKDRDQIRKYWHEDYEFFESRGIHFS
jgi:hypothetical protein